MRINHQTDIAAIQELANNAVGSEMEYTWDAASRLKRTLIRRGWHESDDIPEKFLATMAMDALEGIS